MRDMSKTMLIILTSFNWWWGMGGDYFDRRTNYPSHDERMCVTFTKTYK